MISESNNFNYFSENKMTKLANLVQFKRMPMFCLEDWEGLGPVPQSLSTPLMQLMQLRVEQAKL